MTGRIEKMIDELVKSHVEGQTIVGVKRRGESPVFRVELSNGVDLDCELRFVEPPSDPNQTELNV